MVPQSMGISENGIRTPFTKVLSAQWARSSPLPRDRFLGFIRTMANRKTAKSALFGLFSSALSQKPEKYASAHILGCLGALGNNYFSLEIHPNKNKALFAIFLLAKTYADLQN